MAIYRINPGDMPLGAGIPEGLTERLGSNHSWSVVADAESPSGRSIRVIGGAANSRNLLSIDALDADANKGTVDMICLIRQGYEPTALAAVSGLGARGTGTNGSETIAAGIMGIESGASAGPQVASTRYLAGAVVGVWSENEDIWTTETLYWLRLQVSGTVQTCTLYPFNDPLGTALGSANTTAPASNADNWTGLFAFVDEVDTEFLFIGVGTDTDSAPLPAPRFTGTIPTLNATEGVAFSEDLSGYFTTYAGAATYTISAGTLPAWASLNSTTGVISGTPDNDTNITGLAITATDEDAQTAVSNSFDIDVAASGTVVKGASIVLYTGSTLQASITGITAMWWDANPPTGNPVFTTATASTDASGVLTVDLDSATALDIGDPGHLSLYKLDGTDEKDSLAWQGRLLVEDIS